VKLLLPVLFQLPAIHSLWAAFLRLSSHFAFPVAFLPACCCCWLGSMTENQPALYHNDATPKTKGEARQVSTVETPPSANTFDLQLALVGRTAVEDSFERQFPTSALRASGAAIDKADGPLILRKARHFSRIDELPNPTSWLHTFWPAGGAALVFERNPALENGLFEARAFDAEDDAGRPIELASFDQNKLYPLDMTDKAHDNGPFSTLIMAEPAPAAKSVKIWMTVSDATREARTTHVEIKGIAVPPRKK